MVYLSLWWIDDRVVEEANYRVSEVVVEERDH